MASPILPMPPRTPMVELRPNKMGRGGLPIVINHHEWVQYVERIRQLLEGAGGYWTTANRPTGQGRWDGRSGFNTTTGKPEWWDGSQWVDATGAAA